MFKVLLISSIMALALALRAPSEAETNAKNAALQHALNLKAPKANSAAAQAQGPSADAQAPGPSEKDTNNKNAARQHGVNKQAAYFGAGLGTAPYYGVPGTGKKGVYAAPVPAYGAYGYGRNAAYNGVYQRGYPVAFAH